MESQTAIWENLTIFLARYFHKWRMELKKSIYEIIKNHSNWEYSIVGEKIMKIFAFMIISFVELISIKFVWDRRENLFDYFEMLYQLLVFYHQGDPLRALKTNYMSIFNIFQLQILFQIFMERAQQALKCLVTFQATLWSHYFQYYFRKRRS